MKIFASKTDTNAYKVLVTARYSNVDVQSAEPSNQDTAQSPNGILPVFSTSEGSLFEINAAARYVARLGKSTMYSQNAFENAQIDQWVDFASQEIDLPASVWVFPILKLIPNNATATQKAKGDVRRILEILDKYLATRTYLVGQRISLADVCVATSLYPLYQHVLDAGFRKPFVNTNRWFLTTVNQPEFIAVAGNITLCDKMKVAEDSPASADANANNNNNNAKKGGKKEEKPKEAPKKEEKPKEEKPAKKPSKKDEEEEEEENYEDEGPKAKNPLDLLPASKLNMDEWKRTYSNNDTRPVALPWFWEKYDPTGYCIYFGNYKYNEEHTKLFMTCNFVSGFIQRLDKLRKYGFGSFVIFGEEPKLEVSCCFLFRGTEIPPEMKEVDDFPHYEWTKANTEDAATRDLINDYFAWDGNFGGRKFTEGKIFK